ncbi:MAG: hypothetical protein CMJ78_19095 [Planctomycetaceae bacterium]|nr:hypothetical protein [Planctomycetaceae bacterium]
MLSFYDEGSRLCDGVTRREWLRIGSVGMGGLSLPTLLSKPAQADSGGYGSFGKAKSVILFGLTGGAPQHDTFDPKPQAPEQIRGEFGTIDSKTPGLSVGELMPKISLLTDKLAVMRAVVTGDSAHSSSGYQMLTGIPHQPLNRESAPPKPPNDWPCVAALVRALKDDTGRLPSSVVIPEHIWNDGNKPWPGQDAGFLGRPHDPWLIHCDPSENTFNIPGMKLPEDIVKVRFDARRSLLKQVDAAFEKMDRSKAVESYNRHAQHALGLIGGSQARSAFDMTQEPDSVRDHYGRSRYAQSCLLARRLVEAGVSLVQINWTRIKGYENQGGWDTHKKHNESLKTLLMPIMDQCFSALIEDLDQRGLLDETLVVWAGEFGHTPKFNRNAGRDHWGHAFSAAMVGGGIQGGVVHGETDGHAAYPVSGIVRPKDMIATMFHCLGYAPETEVHDPLGRPLPISRGRVIHEIV